MQEWVFSIRLNYLPYSKQQKYKLNKKLVNLCFFERFKYFKYQVLYLSLKYIQLWRSNLFEAMLMIRMST